MHPEANQADGEWKKESFSSILKKTRFDQRMEIILQNNKKELFVSFYYNVSGEEVQRATAGFKQLAPSILGKTKWKISQGKIAEWFFNTSTYM